MNSRIATILETIGLALREIQAIEREPIHLVQDSPQGFGLTGGTGVGKTWHMAQRIGFQVVRIVTQCPIPDTAKIPYAYAKWVNWPDTAEILKGWVAQGFHQDLERFIEKCTICGQLYLDDIGQERITNENDYALGILRTILDSRYRNNRPVFWTSNLDLKGLTAIYGARVVSRIIDAWPPLRLDGPDLRLKRGA